MCEINLIPLILCHQSREMLSDICRIGFRIFICSHEVERIQQNCSCALLVQVIDNHIRADDLSLRNHLFLFKRSEQIFGERAQIFEFISYKFARFLLVFIRGIKLFDVLDIFFFQCVDHLISSFRIPFIKIISGFYQRICCTRHGRKNNKCRLAGCCDQSGYMLHTICRTDRRAAEFHYFHTHLTKNPL